MRIFFSVGEPSGDLHGANLIRRLKSQDPSLEFVGFGGPKMADAGCELHFDLTTMAVMFLGEVIKNIRFFFRLIGQTNDYFAAQDVDAVVLIDYPGFNWWIARKAKKHGIPVFYYGIPQVWAWAPWRVRKIRKLVDHVLCKLPFEVDWFAQRNCQATYVGHPYFDQLTQQTYDQEFLNEMATDERPLLTLLPGSRNQEVKNVLPILLSTVKQVRAENVNCRFAIASFNQSQYEWAVEKVVESGLPVDVYVERTPELMKASYACVACSGSVSMELLHHRKPTVIVYQVKRWIMLAQSFMLRTKFITLVNLIAAKDIRKTTWRPFDPDVDQSPCVMPEYLSAGNPSEKVAKRILRWLTHPSDHQAKVVEMDELANKYALPGATERAADYVFARLQNTEQHAPSSSSEPSRSGSEESSRRSVA